MSTLMTPGIAVGDEVTVRNVQQLGLRIGEVDLLRGIEHGWGVWYLLDVCGVAAWIGRSPLSLIRVATPLSNLRPAVPR